MAELAYREETRRQDALQKLRAAEEQITRLARGGRLSKHVDSADLGTYYPTPDELRTILAQLGATLSQDDAMKWLAIHHPDQHIARRPPPRSRLGLPLGSREVEPWRDFALPLDDTWYFPLWQFQHPNALRFVLETLGPAMGFAPWAMASFLVTPNPFVDAETPLEALFRDDEDSSAQVAQAVTLFGEHGAP
jgi:hypothetical protein